ncbi:ABC transporter permease [Paenibacillus sp. UMB4589-SE434]|uniref:ABC transporter permease n=1 Tax=Paenibacillus sp. UMB4589-SE434 TaxID=3046314 RepID=UPI00254C2A72|nr:ABC transporter permease [Paenibacillus sp. UMB4589-SE434]MDK8181947.1 ABC transporter permease [Paenibacillus sp. UMB4589-SE434]
MNTFHIARHFIYRLLMNKRSWVFTFILPSCLVAFIMFQVNVHQEAKPVVAYVDQDGSVWSKALLKQLGESFVLSAESDAGLMETKLTDRKLSHALLIPQDYGDRLMAGQMPNVRLMRLGVNESSVMIQLALEQRTREWAALASALAQSGKLDSEAHAEQGIHAYMNNKPVVEKLDNSQKIPVNLRISMGLFMMFMLMTGLNSITVMLEDKQKYTMIRTYAAPVRSWEISVGYFGGAVVYGSIQIGIVLLLTRVLLGIDMGISGIEQFMFLELFLWAGLSIGCMLGALFPSSEAYAQIGFVFVVPTSMLGGCYWPISIMEPYMQKVSYFVPQRWALDAIEKLASGGSMASVMIHAGVLLLFTIIFLGIGSAALRPSNRSVA